METTKKYLDRRQIKKMWYIYTMEYYSATKENKIVSFEATWMDQEIIILSEVSQTEKDISYDISYMQNLKTKKIQMHLFTKQQQTTKINKLMVTKWETWQGITIRIWELTNTHHYI